MNDNPTLDSGGAGRAGLLEFPPDWGCRLIERQAEFRRARRVLEIGGGNFARAISLAIRHPKKEFIAIDFRHEPEAQKNIVLATTLPNISFIKLDALERFFAEHVFDFAFSIAVMEHVPELERFLSVTFSLLKPRGIYAYFQAPFWTCMTGHHFNHNRQEVREALNSYEHIRFDAEEMRSYLAGFATLPFEVDECVRKVYSRPDLSRLSPTETRRIVEASRFAIVTWDERPDPDFDESKARAAQRVHAARYTLDDFRVGGAFVRLLRP